MPSSSRLTPSVQVPRRVANILLNALRGGVVPRIGLPYITVGREAEVTALLHDLELVADGGASFRFVVGRYGSGKSFLLQTIRNRAMEDGFVVADADLTPDRRLQGTGGQGLATYRELIANLSTNTRREGGALTLVLDRWAAHLVAEVEQSGIAVDEAGFMSAAQQRVTSSVRDLGEMVHGFDFAQALVMYLRAYTDNDEELKGNVVRWFRGEYRTKSEAKASLGMNVIIGDDDWYDYLKLFAIFLVGAGYKGLVVLIDELVNLYKIPNAVSRGYNYEKLLGMYNDALQGRARHLGVVMGGTPQAVEDRRRGLYSYEALRSRLTGGRLAPEGVVDMFAPVIALRPLTNEETLVLIEKLADIHAGLNNYDCALTEDDLIGFLQIELGRVGADKLVTPREVIRDFIQLLDLLYQYPSMTMTDLLGSQEFTFAQATPDDAIDAAAIAPEYAEFSL